MRNIIKLHDYSSLMHECHLNFFESNGPVYVVSPLNESDDLRLINEGLASGLAKDAIQYMVGAAAEYGLGAVTMPAGGAGVAIGPAVETVVDAVFGAETVSSTVTAVKNIAANVGRFSQMLNNALANAKNCVMDPDSYYDSIREIITEGLSMLGSNMQGRVDKLAEELRGVIEKLIDKLVDAVTQGLKIVVPDATASAAISASIRTALTAAANTPYTMMSKAVLKYQKVANFLSNPEEARSFFDEMIEKLSDLSQDFADVLERTSYAKTMMAGFAVGLGGGALGGAALKKFGPDGLRKLSDLIIDKKPLLLDIVETVITVIVPTLYAALAIFQILMQGEYKAEEDEMAAMGGGTASGTNIIKRLATSRAQNESKAYPLYSYRYVRM